MRTPYAIRIGFQFHIHFVSMIGISASIKILQLFISYIGNLPNIPLPDHERECFFSMSDSQAAPLQVFRLVQV